MEKNSKIYIAGHSGLVGSAMHRNLKEKGFTNIILKNHQELDLLNQAEVDNFFKENKIDYCILAAAKVGGILYNKNYQADFLYENIMISANVIKAAAENNVKKLVYLGSSCIYPKYAEQPITEEALLTGELEPTNEGYAIAKIAGLKLCEKFKEQYGHNFVSVMPTNLYGPGDNYHPEHSHVIPGLLRRFHNAKLDQLSSVDIWGTGQAMREFMHVEDLAEGLYFVLSEYNDSETINLGTGLDCSIAELAKTIKEVVGFQGDLKFDHSKPDGTPRKVLDISKITSLGWSPKYNLKQGLERTYQWIQENKIFE